MIWRSFIPFVDSPLTLTCLAFALPLSLLRLRVPLYTCHLTLGRWLVESKVQQLPRTQTHQWRVNSWPNPVIWWPLKWLTRSVFFLYAFVFGHLCQGVHFWAGEERVYRPTRKTRVLDLDGYSRHAPLCCLGNDHRTTWKKKKRGTWFWTWHFEMQSLGQWLVWDADGWQWISPWVPCSSTPLLSSCRLLFTEQKNKLPLSCEVLPAWSCPWLPLYHCTSPLKWFPLAVVGDDCNPRVSMGALGVVLLQWQGPNLLYLTA